MHEKINYLRQEAQKFQENPHVALVLYSQVPEKWQVDLRWREDADPTNIDAEHSLTKGLSFSEALEDAKKWGKLLNVPVAKYEDDFIELLVKSEGPSTKDQKLNLQLIMLSKKTQRFPTH